MLIQLPLPVCFHRSVCVCALGDCVWFLFDSWQQSAGLLCTEPALTQRRQPLSSPVVEPLAPDHQPSVLPSSPQKHLLCLFLFSLLTLPLTLPLLLSSFFSCALYPFFCCILQGQLYLPRCLSPGLWLLNNRLRSSPLSVDYFADLQGRSDDDPGLYWEFYGSAVCGEY